MDASSDLSEKGTGGCHGNSNLVAHRVSKFTFLSWRLEGGNPGGELLF